MSWELGSSMWGSICGAVEDCLNSQKVSKTYLVDAIVCDASSKKFGGIVAPCLIPDENERKAKIAEIQAFEKKLRKEYKKLAKDTLANHVMELIEKNNTTSNGGHEIYIDENGFFIVDMVDVEKFLD